MTDREEFEKWWEIYVKEGFVFESGFEEWGASKLAWQARSELDAVRIKELEAKLDKAKEVLNSCLGGDDYYNRPIIEKALQELNK